MRILIIEDNRRLAESLRDILKHLRYEADISGNGLDGYEQMMACTTASFWTSCCPGWTASPCCGKPAGAIAPCRC